MSSDDIPDSYHSLAHRLYTAQITEEELQEAAAGLPRLDPELLSRAAQQVEDLAGRAPRLGWALARVAQAASIAQNADPFLQSLAAWYLGVACNYWTQPKRAEAAISLARQGFLQLDEHGWVAACDWQANTLVWARPSFVEAARTLEGALRALEQAGFLEFVPRCRLALAYAHILIGEHEAAVEEIQLSEQEYTARGDLLNQARCWLTLAGSLRRRDHFQEAFELLERARAVFEQQNTPVEQAKAHYQIALGYLLHVDHLQRAVSHFEIAAELFEAADLGLWHAMCNNNLGSVHMFRGELRRADELYRAAGACFSLHEVQGLLADNLNDRGKLNILLGQPSLSIEQFQECAAINERLGSEASAAVAIFNLGEAYGQVGRYQDALFHLERAIERLEPLQLYSRLATCEKYIASIWSRLGQPEQAHHYLDLAASHYEKADQKALVSLIHTHRATIFFQQGRNEEVLKALEHSLHILESQELRPQAALAKRLLGEALLRLGEREQALTYLKQAVADFEKMEIGPELAACQIALGVYWKLDSQPEQAKAAFEKAIRIHEGIFPEIEWQARLELGTLAEVQADWHAAIEHLRAVIQALTKIRQNFRQPALAGSYLQTPAQAFDRIVHLAAQMDMPQDVLNFIEASKASTLLSNLITTSASQKDPSTNELEALKAEIDLLKTQLRVSLDEAPGFLSAARDRQVRAELRRKIEEYDRLKARLERKALVNHTLSPAADAFEITSFRQRANAYLKRGWIALDHYLTEEELTTILLTDDECEVYRQPVSKRLDMALRACDRARRNAQPPPRSDLEVLGRALIPRALLEVLTPETHLIIAPHRRLHHVPWPALRPDSAGSPLVSLCIPVVVESLHTLALLWDRADQTAELDKRTGLLVGLSRFQGLYDDLPFVRDEIASLASRLGPGGRILAEEEANWQALLKCLDHTEEPQSARTGARFAWLHIASHFSPDRHSGRVSGIVLHNGKIWLDQLHDLAPLPPLVSLSACSSSESFLYEGDERVDLRSICLIAGTHSIVGAAWPVLDGAASTLILRFYDQYLDGCGPAQATALAQRQYLAANPEDPNWMSFCCAGVP